MSAACRRNGSRLRQLIMEIREQAGPEYDFPLSGDDQGCLAEDLYTCPECGSRVIPGNGSGAPEQCPFCLALGKNTDVRECRCRRCGYSWNTSDVMPARCPGCRSRTWNSEFIKVRCGICGTEWKDRTRAGAFLRCPGCGQTDSGRVSVSGRCVALCAYGRKDNPERLYDLIAGKEPDVQREILLKEGCGGDYADILISFLGGKDPVSVTTERNTSLHKVMVIIAPYAKLLGRDKR